MRLTNLFLRSSAFLLLLALCACGGGGSGGGGGGGTPTPTITQLVPSSMQAGVPLTPLVVHGTNLPKYARILMDGVAVSQTYDISSVVVRGEIPASMATLGTHQITIIQSGVVSNALPLTVTAPVPGPQVMQAVPGFFAGWEVPTSITAADLNKDGRADAIVGGRPTGSSLGLISILYGQADGTLSAPQAIALPNAITSVVAGDVDGDGNQDLVAVQGDGIQLTVSVLLGDGQGNFQPASSPQTLSGVAASLGFLVDIDGDGKPDLVLGYQSNGSSATPDVIVWLKNAGGGSFGPAAPLAANTANNFGFVVADFDGDGNPDIVYATATAVPGGQQFLRCLRNTGNGQFLDQPVAGLNGLFGTPTVIDFNLDGIPDLVIQGNGALYSYAGNGDGSFTLVATGAIPGFGGFTNLPLVAGDFDHDGFPDLAGQAGTNEPAAMLYMYGDGHGNFTPQIVVGPYGAYCAAGDFNGDGLPDVVIPDLQNYVSLSLGRTDRNYASPAALTPAASANVSVGDVLGNGSLEVFVGGDPFDLIPGTLFQNQGNNSFQIVASSDPNAFALEDLTGRGVADLLGNQGGQFVVWPNNGPLDFSASSPITIPMAGTGLSIPIQIADMDGDGRPDVVGGGEILYGNGGYQFTPVTTLSVTWPYIVGDFNGDGRLDVAMGSSVYLNAGNRSFQAVQPRGLPTIANLQTWAVGDFNGDGKDDIALVLQGSGIISLYFSNGDGTFYQAAQLDCGQFPDALGTGDFGGNGRVDLVVALQGSYQACMLFNQGNGQFYRSFVATGADAVGMRARDLNGDHKPDLVISNFYLTYRPPNVNVIFHK